MSSLSTATSSLLVALGVVPGAWLRYRVVNHLEPALPRKHWGTFVVNVVACFALGLLAAMQLGGGPGARSTMLLLGTGFFGGFSTFSSFVAELHQVLQRRHWGEACALAGGSLLAGLLAMQAGLVIGALR